MHQGFKIWSRQTYSLHPLPFIPARNLGECCLERLGQQEPSSACLLFKKLIPYEVLRLLKIS